MTALTEYERLEAPGLWRSSPEAQRLNVIISIGDATLTLSDSQDRALSHWSLPALRRLNPGIRPALYAPSADPDEGETLEIDDGDMIDAIEKVRRVVDRYRPRSGRLRLVLTLASLALAGTFVFVWLPQALVRQTVSVLPDVTRAAVGQRLLNRIRRVAGSPCQGGLGRQALARLGQHLLPGEPVQLVVLTAGVTGAGHLPGGIILLSRALIDDYDAPDALAGFVLAESERARQADPMQALLEHAGTLATARLLTTGALDDSVLDSYAETLLTTPPTPLPDAALLARFAEARLPATPYAYALDPSGETTLGLIEADPVPIALSIPVLDDADWVSLEGICAD